PNLREALEFAIGAESADVASAEVLEFTIALQPFWFACGHMVEGLHWVGRVLDHVGDEPSVTYVKALCHHCIANEVQGNLAEGATFVARARSIADRLSDPVADAWVDFAEGRHATLAGDLPRAHRLLERAQEVFVAHDDVLSQVLVLLTIGTARLIERDAEGAIATYAEVLRITEPRGETVFRSQALSATAVAAWSERDRQRALDAATQALRVSRPRQDRFLASVCLEILAWIHAADGDNRRAATLMGAAQAMAQLGEPIVTFGSLNSEQESGEERARTMVGSAAFDGAYAEGRKLDYEAAVDLALGERSRPAPAAAASPTDLTRREREVAGLVAEGLTNKAIAARLTISRRTVDGHVEHVLAKLGFSSRAQIAVWVAQQAGA
ncbi:LuxR C-terminal-related transcriptional regulator, partial [Rhodococcus sp. NPDC003318]|uniref:LuxR C-terminal-related transcriptional regulator n=1 Tax=Rhodococcus sp. NPDC003318 TaxID=3364503 RepID=UPI00368E48F4